MRYSKQKKEILKVVLDSYNHPDAKEIYRLVKKNIPNISLGTVYRNLNILVNEGLIRKIFIYNGNDRYDKMLTNHNHVICQKCGKLHDISFLLDESNINMFEKETGFKITICNFNINGICEECLKGRNN